MLAIDLQAIDAAKLQTDPFDFLVVPGCVSPAALEAVNRDYPQIERPGNLNLDGLHYGAAFAAFMDELQGPDLAEHLGRKFSVELGQCPVPRPCASSVNRATAISTRITRSKVITVLVYFNQAWSENAGQLRMLRSATDIEDYAAEVPPLGGTLLAFRRTDHSWHGHQTLCRRAADGTDELLAGHPPCTAGNSRSTASARA